MSNFPEKNETKELDLLDIIGKVGSFFWLSVRKLYNTFKKLFILLWWMITYCLQKTLWIVAFIAGMFIVNLIKGKDTSLKYEHTIMVKALTNNIELHDFVNQSFSGIAPGDSIWKQVLNLPTYDIAKKIVSINAYWGIDYNYDKIVDIIDVKNKYNLPLKWDTLMAPSMIVNDRFFIVAIVTDKTIIPYIRNGIEEKIYGNNAFRTNTLIRRQEINASIEGVKYQITILDSLQKHEYFLSNQDNDRKTKLFMQAQGQVISFTERDQRLLHEEALLLRQRLITFESQSQMLDLEIGEGDVPKQIVSIRQYSYLMAILFALLAAIVWDYRKRLLRHIRRPLDIPVHRLKL
jgi:hypothetical protein